jgi:hypothetical protein
MMKQRILIALVVAALAVPAASPVSAAPAALRVRVIAQVANVRSEASLASSVIQTARSGSVFNVIKTVDDWYLVELPGGGQGYLNTSVVEEIREEAAVPTAQPAAPAPSAATGSAPGQAATWTAAFEVMGAYLMPSDQAFKDIYGGGLMYGGGLAFRLGQRLRLWLDGMYYQGSGKLTYTLEETKLTLIPIGAGVAFDLGGGGLTPYVGAGARYYMYKESNVIGDVSANGIGFVGFAGLKLRLAKGIAVDLRGGYSMCKMTPADFDIDVGGLELGGGLVFEF